MWCGAARGGYHHLRGPKHTVLTTGRLLARILDGGCLSGVDCQGQMIGRNSGQEAGSGREWRDRATEYVRGEEGVIQMRILLACRSQR